MFYGVSPAYTNNVKSYTDVNEKDLSKVAENSLFSKDDKN